VFIPLLGGAPARPAGHPRLSGAAAPLRSSAALLFVVFCALVVSVFALAAQSFHDPVGHVARGGRTCVYSAFDQPIEEQVLARSSRLNATSRDNRWGSQLRAARCSAVPR
jgi:hypothetical protein